MSEQYTERTTLRRVYFGIEIVSRHAGEADDETDGWLHQIGETQFKTLAMAINHAREIDNEAGRRVSSPKSRRTKRKVD